MNLAEDNWTPQQQGSDGCVLTALLLRSAQVLAFGTASPPGRHLPQGRQSVSHNRAAAYADESFSVGRIAAVSVNRLQICPSSASNF